MTDFEIEYIPEDEDNKSYVNQMEYISAIINKIKSGDDADIENCGLRPIRELLQNADDAGATQLVFRFDKDRLWVQNNGLTMEDRYLSALSSLGKEDKKEDAGTSGTFGTGFRSTHMFTDTPEIEWVEFHPGVEKYRVIAKKMTLSLEEWKDIPERKNLASSQFMQSEGVRDPKKLGVFFSFPWRVTNETNREEFDEYLWDVPRVQELALDLKERIGPMLFGCRSISRVRVILTCAEEPEKNFLFEAENTMPLSMIFESSATTGTLNLSTTTSNLRREYVDTNVSGAWSRQNHQWYANRRHGDNLSTSLDYFWGKRPVYDEKSQFIDNNGNVVCDAKRYWNLCILLLPLSPSAPNLPKYTPIPLGGLTNEQIGIITFCPPAENRREIDTAQKQTKQYLGHITMAAINLYAEHINTACSSVVNDDRIDGETKEEIILSQFPKTPASKWLIPTLKISEQARPSPTNPTTAKIWEALEKLTRNHSLASVDNDFLPLSKTVHTISKSGDGLDARIAKVLRSTKQPVLGDAWAKFYAKVLQSESVAFRTEVWNTFFWYENGGFYGSRAVEYLENFIQIVNLNLPDLVGNDIALSRLHSSMLELAAQPPRDWKEELAKLYLVRDGAGNLLTLNDAATNNRVVVLPPKFSHIEPSLKSLIGEEILLHSTNKQDTIDVLESIGEDDVLKLNSEKLIEIVDASTKKYPAKHQHLSQHGELYEAVSVALVTAVNEGLSRDQIRGKRFMPVLRGDFIQTMEENTLRGGQLVWLLDDPVKPGTASQAYHRDFVFKKPDEDTYASMPEYLKWRLRFLEMHSSTSKDDISRVVSFFSLNEAVNNQGKATNLIRTLLTDGGPNSKPSLNTSSIFKPGEFSKWQPQHGPAPLDEDELDIGWIVVDEQKEKLEVLIWLLKPYGDVPKTLGHLKISNVPYLPTHEGKWITPGEASTCTDKELLKLIGRSSSGLHPDLVASLHTNVLKGLGVSGAITIEQAQDILHDVQAGRNTNRGLMINLLRHFFEFFDCKNDSNKHLYAKFCNQPGPWVPVGSEDSASLRAADEAYWPNEEYDSFLGMHILDPQTIPEEISDTRVKELQKFFGFATKLRTEDALILLDADRPSQLADEVDFEALQKYIAKNGFTTEVTSSDLPEAMIIMDSDGQEHRVPKGAVLATVAKKKTYEKMLTSAEAIPVFAHTEFAGGKKFCERLIEIGFCKDSPSEDDLIKELKHSTIEAGACSAIWTYIGKMEPSQQLLRLRFKDERLMYADGGVVYSQDHIAINNGTENPLLDGGGIQLVLDAKKLNSNALSLMESYDFQDFREISSEDVLGKATEAGHYDIPLEDFDRVKRRVLDSEHQLFAVLEGIDKTYRLVNQEDLKDYIMFEQDHFSSYSTYVLRKEEWLVKPLGDTAHDSRVAEHAVLFSQTNPEINPLLEDLTSTPNTAMGEAISTYLGEDSNLGWDESQQDRFSSDSLKVEMVQGSIPRILQYRFQGQHRRVRLGGLPNFQKVSEDEINLYLSRDPQQCGPKEVARLVEKCLLNISVRPYNGFVDQLSTYLANPQDGRDLFESNKARETANTLRHHYGGCQIQSCRVITPYSEGRGALTAEKRKSIIGNRATFYRWEQSINANYPIGQNIWLCPRHHTLWERGLIRIDGLHDDASIKENADKLEKHAEDFNAELLQIRVYDGEGHDFNPNWHDDQLIVAKGIMGSNHGKAILASLVNWVKHRLNQ